MCDTSKMFYCERYSEIIKNGQNPVEVVNSLAERLMKNDSEALDIVFCVINYKFYDRAVSLAKRSGWTLDLADDILVEACFEFSKLCTSGKGLQDSVLTQGVYGLLSSSIKYGYLHILEKNKKYSENTSFAYEDIGILDVVNEKNEQENNHVEDLFEQMFHKEEYNSDKKVIDFFRQALVENQAVPYQVITYCYSTLLPLVFKESIDPDFLDKINILSARGNGNSWYNRETGEIGGDIKRKNFTLLNWALEAMNNETTENLSKEFEELYQHEPIIGIPFSWGESYLSGLRKPYKEKLVKDTIITNDFDTDQIKNWSARVGMKLYEDAKRRMCQDKEFRKSAVGRAEKIIFDLSR